MRVDRFLSDSASRRPQQTYLIADGERVSYADMEDRASRLAQVLHRHGVERGDRVIVFAEPGALAVAAVFAILRAGAVFSPINPTTKANKLAFVLNNCRAKAVITQASLLAVSKEAVAQAPSVALTLVDNAPAEINSLGIVSLQAALVEASEVSVPNDAIDIDLAMIIYTSGSTGFPKGVMMTHQNVVAAATSITTYLESSPNDVILNALPLSFDYGLYQVLMAAKVGATVIQEKSFAFPAAVLRIMQKERATGFPLVPTMAALLLRMRDLSPGSFPELRYITNTAAALPPAHIQRLQELFPKTRIFSMYGLTECKRCTYLPPEQLATHSDSVGKAIPNTEAYVVDDRGGKLGPGEIGELVIRGAHVMKGYWENPEATDRVLQPGPFPWEKVLHTGDLFRTDDDGWLYFVGRKDDIIKTRGEKVSPKEVENVLYALPGVKEVAVVGVPDPMFGSAVKAVIVASGELTERDVIAHCAKNLEDFMVPRLVEFVAELPKTDTGKIRRSQVQAETLEASSTER